MCAWSKRLSNKMQIQVGIITISDRASSGEYDDLGGPALKEAGRFFPKPSFPMMQCGSRKRSARFPNKAVA